MVDLDSPKERRKRNDLWSYLFVGLVGAVIGGFLVAGIAPQVLIHRMGLTYTSANPPTITESGTSCHNSHGLARQSGSLGEGHICFGEG